VSCLSACCWALVLPPCRRSPGRSAAAALSTRACWSSRSCRSWAAWLAAAARSSAACVAACRRGGASVLAVLELLLELRLGPVGALCLHVLLRLQRRQTGSPSTSGRWCSPSSGGPATRGSRRSPRSDTCSLARRSRRSPPRSTRQPLARSANRRSYPDAMVACRSDPAPLWGAPRCAASATAAASAWVRCAWICCLRLVERGFRLAALRGDGLQQGSPWLVSLLWTRRYEK
jgi:hypothetical protein